MRNFILALCLSACASSSKVTTSPAHSNGQLRWDYEMVDGVPNGHGRVFYADGTPKSEGEYVNGVKHGMFTFYRDDGSFELQIYFWKNTAVWRSTDATAKPPKELVSGLTAFSGSTPRIGSDFGTTTEAPSAPALRLSFEPPMPYFASLDRTTGVNRVGLQFGFGGAGERPFGSVTRLEVFGNYRFSEFGVYGQFSESTFEVEPNMRLSGRQTLELGGTYQRPIAALGPLSARAGLLVPVGNDTSEGYLASTAGATQRAADAAATFPSTLAVRTGASLTHQRERLVLQGDAGIDWLLGGPNSSLDALARANAGVGLGFQSVLVGLEVANTVRISEPSRHLHVMGVSGTFWVNQIWCTGFASRSLDGEMAVTGAIGYELSAFDS